MSDIIYKKGDLYINTQSESKRLKNNKLNNPTLSIGKDGSVMNVSGKSSNTSVSGKSSNTNVSGKSSNTSISGKSLNTNVSGINSGFGVTGSGFGVTGSGFGVTGSGYGVRGSGFGVTGSGYGELDGLCQTTSGSSLNPYASYSSLSTISRDSCGKPYSLENPLLIGTGIPAITSSTDTSKLPNQTAFNQLSSNDVPQSTIQTNMMNGVNDGVITGDDLINGRRSGSGRNGSVSGSDFNTTGGSRSTSNSSKPLTPGSIGAKEPSLAQQMANIRSNCGKNNVCSFIETYQGITSVKELNSVIKKYESTNVPVVKKNTWLAADRTFNVGYDEIMVASVYQFKTYVPEDMKFTIFTTNKGYLYINDNMYMIENKISTSLSVYMLENINLKKNVSGDKTDIYVLVPGNSAILINNNKLLATGGLNDKSLSEDDKNDVNVEWKSNSFDLNNSFKDINPLEFGITMIKSNPFSDVQNVTIIDDMMKTLDLPELDYSTCISNTIHYKTYSEKELKNSNNIKSIVYVPGDDLYVESEGIEVIFTVFASNIFQIYNLASTPKYLNEGSQFDKKVVSDKLTIYSQNIRVSLVKGINKIVIVLPANSLLYIPFCNLGHKDRQTRQNYMKRQRNGQNIETIRSDDDQTEVLNCTYNTDSSWIYSKINVPYRQFNYLRFYNLIYKVMKLNDSLQESFINHNTYFNTNSMSIKNIEKYTISNGFEHFENTEYKPISSAAYEEDHIEQSEKTRLEILNLANNLNSDKQFNMEDIKKNITTLLSGYDKIISNINNSKQLPEPDINRYNTIKQLYVKYKKDLEDISIKEEKYNTYKKIISELQTNNDQLYANIQSSYNNINNLTSESISKVENLKNSASSTLMGQYQKILTQFEKLKTVIASQKIASIQTEYKLYQDVVKELTLKLPDIQKEQNSFSSNTSSIVEEKKTFVKNCVIYYNNEPSLNIKPFTSIMDQFITDYRNREQVINNIMKSINSAQELLKKNEFSGTNSNSVNSEDVENQLVNNFYNPIRAYVEGIKSLYVAYNDNYNSNVNGLKTKLVQTLQSTNNISNLVKNYLKKDIPSISSVADIKSYIDSIDYSFVWKNTNGNNAIASSKSNLEKYLTDLLNLMNTIKGPFGINIKTFDQSTISQLDQIVLNRGNEIIAYGTSAKKGYANMIIDANNNWNNMMKDAQDMMENKIPLDQTKINNYYLKIKSIYDLLVGTRQTFNNFITQLNTNLVTPIKTLSSQIDPNKYATYSTNISNDMIKLIDNRSNDAGTTYDGKNIVNKFTNRYERFTNQQSGNMFNQNDQNVYEHLDNETGTNNSTIKIMSPSDYEKLSNLKSVGSVNILQLSVRGKNGGESFQVCVGTQKNGNTINFMKPNYGVKLSTNEQNIIIPLDETPVVSIVLRMFLDNPKVTPARDTYGVIISSMKYNGVDIKDLIVNNANYDSMRFQQMKGGVLSNPFAQRIHDFTYNFNGVLNMFRFDILKGLWVDENSYQTTLDKMDGEINIIGLFEATQDMGDLNAKIFTLDPANITLLVNGTGVDLDSNGMSKNLFSLKDGINFIQIKIQLSTPTQIKVPKRFFTFYIKSGWQTIKNKDSIPFDSNTPSLWRYNFEKNSYLTPITLPSYKYNSSCNTYCSTKKEDIAKLSPNSSFKSLCLNGKLDDGSVVECDSIGTGSDMSKNITCNCLPISKEQFQNMEHYSEQRNLSSYYGGTNNNGVKEISKDFVKDPLSLLGNQTTLNSIILHKVPQGNQGDSYLSGMTLIDSDNNIYNQGIPYTSDVQSRLYQCNSGFVGMKMNQKNVPVWNNTNVFPNRASLVNRMSPYNAAFECNEQIYEKDINYMNILKNKTPRFYTLRKGIDYTDNDLGYFDTMNHKDCSKKCDETPECMAYVLNRNEPTRTTGCWMKSKLDPQRGGVNEKRDTYYLTPSQDNNNSNGINNNILIKYNVPTDYKYFLNAHSLTQANETPVSSWGVFKQNDPSKQPIYYASGGHNNGPYIKFNGTSQFLQGNPDNFPWVSTSGQTTFMLVRYDSASLWARFRTFFGYTVNLNNTSNGAYYFNDFGSPEWCTNLFNANGKQVTGARNHGGINPGTFYLFTMSYANPNVGSSFIDSIIGNFWGDSPNNNFRAYLNGESKRLYRLNYPDTDINGATPFIGGFPGYNSYKDISISAIVHYNRVLSGDERNSVENYLLNKLSTGSLNNSEYQETLQRNKINYFDV